MMINYNWKQGVLKLFKRTVESFAICFSLIFSSSLSKQQQWRLSVEHCPDLLRRYNFLFDTLVFTFHKCTACWNPPSISQGHLELLFQQQHNGASHYEVCTHGLLDHYCHLTSFIFINFGARKILFRFPPSYCLDRKPMLAKPHLQMRRGVKIFAFFTRTSTFNIVHTDSDGIVGSVDHRSIRRVSIPTLSFTPGAVASLVITAHLIKKHFFRLKSVFSQSRDGWLLTRFA